MTEFRKDNRNPYVQGSAVVRAARRHREHIQKVVTFALVASSAAMAWATFTSFGA